MTSHRDAPLCPVCHIHLLSALGPDGLLCWCAACGAISEVSPNERLYAAQAGAVWEAMLGRAEVKPRAWQLPLFHDSQPARRKT